MGSKESEKPAAAATHSIYSPGSVDSEAPLKPHDVTNFGTGVAAGPTTGAEEISGKGMDAFVDPDQLEIAAGREREQLEGWIPALATDEEKQLAFEKAFDYRGDVTLTLLNGRVITGYVFDRRVGKSLHDSAVRVIPSTERTKETISYSDIAALQFSGRDTAAGKSFEAWVKKYNEKKAAGEKNIAIAPENLE